MQSSHAIPNSVPTAVVDEFEKHVPAEAKAGIDFEAFAARLKPRPFKRIQTEPPAAFPLGSQPVFSV
jgi:hypothetical protein